MCEKNQQIYKILQFQECSFAGSLGSNARADSLVAKAIYVLDKMAVANALIDKNTRVFTYPQNEEITKVNLEIE